MARHLSETLRRLLVGTNTLLYRQLVLPERGRCGQTKTTFYLSPQKTGGHKWQAQQQSQKQTDSVVWAEAGTLVTQKPQEGEAIVSWPSWKLKAGKLFSESFGFVNLRVNDSYSLLWEQSGLLKQWVCLSGEDWLLTLLSLSSSSLARKPCGAAIYSHAGRHQEWPPIHKAKSMVKIFRRGGVTGLS